MVQPLMELRNVDKFFGSTKALRDVSMVVQPGKILCLLGDNGAGKSTLIKVLSGYHKPTRGQIIFEGQETHFSGPARGPVARDCNSAPKCRVHSLDEHWT